MEVVCESCQARFNVPDDKIPAGKSIRAACPKCKNKLTIPAKDAPPRRLRRKTKPARTATTRPRNHLTLSKKMP